MTTLQFFQDLLDWLLADPAHIVAAASVLAAATPTPDSNTALGKAYKVLEILAVNIIRAKDKGTVAPASAMTADAGANTGNVGAALLVALLTMVSLSACAHQTPAGNVFELRAGYDASVLVPISHYAALPACPQPDGLPCADPAVLDQLRKADTAAKAALEAAEDTVRNHPQMDSSAAIAAADNATAAAHTIIATYNVK